MKTIKLNCFAWNTEDDAIQKIFLIENLHQVSNSQYPGMAPSENNC